MFGTSGPWEWIIILAIVILIFGVGKIADVGPALGKAISGFRRAVKEDDEEEKVEETDSSEEEI
jgi:sec-independent protein translocase protein TatA